MRKEIFSDTNRRSSQDLNLPRSGEPQTLHRDGSFDEVRLGITLLTEEIEHVPHIRSDRRNEDHGFIMHRVIEREQGCVQRGFIQHHLAVEIVHGLALVHVIADDRVSQM